MPLGGKTGSFLAKNVFLPAKTSFVSQAGKKITVKIIFFQLNTKSVILF